MQDQKSGRTSAVSRKPGWRGEETGTLGLQSKFCRQVMACMPAMRRRAFRNHLSFSESMANSQQARRACFCPKGREILPECPDTHSGGNAASESATFRMEKGRSSNPSHLLWRQLFRCSLGPSPTMGNGPRRTRRLRLHLSTERDPVAFQHDAERIILQKFCRLTPPAESRVKPSSDGRGGGGQDRVLNLVVANSVLFSRNMA